MAQVRRVEPVGAAQLGGGSRRDVFGHTVATSPFRSETRALANSPSFGAGGKELPDDLPEGDC